MALTGFLQDNRDLVCGRYSEAVFRARSKKALADLLDVNVCEWLCRMHAQGSREWLEECFGPFLNGAFTKDCGGYDCSVHVAGDGRIRLASNVTAVLGGDMTVEVPDNAVMRVFCACSSLRVVLGERSSLVVHAVEGVQVAGDGIGDGRTVVKRIEDL